MMKQIRYMIFLILIFAFLSEALAQRMVRREVSGDVFMISEIGAMLEDGNDSVKVFMVLPMEHRPDGYKDVDVKKDDALLMLNGKRIKSVATVKEIYEGLAVDDEIKLGLQRGKRLFIESFPKLDPEKAPQMVVRVERDGDGSSEPDTRVMTSWTDDEYGDVVPVPELNGMLVDGDDGVTLKPFPGHSSAGHALQEGDAVKSLNGNVITSLEAFRSIYEKVETGGELSFELERDGAKMKVKLAKKDASQNVFIREESPEND